MNGTSDAVATPAAIPVTEDAAAKSRAQIDRIVYLASLASRNEDVDPMLDDLRGVTASWDGSSPLNVESERKLDDLEARLKHYLITADPVRSFTAESLDQRLAGRTHRGGVKPATRSTILIVVLSVLAAGLSYSPFLPLAMENRQFLAIPMFFVVLHIGISWLYLTTLKNFNDEIRKAFKLVAVAVILFGLAFSQFVVAAAFPQYFADSVVATYIQTWLVAAPYFFIYFGMRMYVRQLGIQTWVSKLSIIVPIWLVLVAARVLLPHDMADAHFYGWAPAAISLTLFALLCLLLVRQIRKVVTSSYAKPMTWMYAYLIVNMVASVSTNFPGDSNGEHIYLLMLVFGIPVQLLLLMTGYSFKKELSK